MSLAERYSRAIRSSDLELQVEVTDVDYLIAAGLVKETLATRLIRLRSEFDTISRTPHKRILAAMLRGFPVAQRHFVAFAVQECPLRGHRLSDIEATEIAIRVLDLFLDPNCPDCDGRGFNGGYGAPTLRCPACRESGKRQHFWKNDAHEGFARWLQASMDSMTERALGEMRRKMRDR